MVTASAMGRVERRRRTSQEAATAADEHSGCGNATAKVATSEAPSASFLRQTLPLLVLGLLCLSAWHEDNKDGQPKRPAVVERIAKASFVTAEAIATLGREVREGRTTAELDMLLRDFLAQQNATAESLHYGGFLGGFLQPMFSPVGRAICGAFDGAVGRARGLLMPGLPPLPLCGFPGHMCISVNSEVCHGVPSKRVLRAGDVVKLDIAVRKDGAIGDSCATFIVESEASPAEESKGARLARVTRESLFLGIFAAGADGSTLGDVGYSIQQHAEAEGFGIVDSFSGHGVGERFHEPPRVLHQGKRGGRQRLLGGQVFTIEPMLTEGAPDTTVTGDGWTVVTRDGSLSAQWEHTVAIRDAASAAGVRVLTKRVDEALPLRLSNRTVRAALFAERYDSNFATLLEASAERLERDWKLSGSSSS